MLFPFHPTDERIQFSNSLEHLHTSLLIMSAQCIIWNRDKPPFRPLLTDSFALPFLAPEFGKTNEYAFFLLPIKFSTIPGHLRW